MVLSSTDSAELAIEASRTFFSTTPAVVFVDASDPDAPATAAAAAEVVGGPVLVINGAVSDDAVDEEVRRLDARIIVQVAAPGDEAAPTVDVEGRTVISLEARAVNAETGRLDPRDERELSERIDGRHARTLPEALALVQGTPEQWAAVATARAAGAAPITVESGDPRSDSETVHVIAAAKALSVVGIGPTFGSAQTLSWRIEVAESGTLLPGGGQLALAGRRVVAVPGEAVAAGDKPLPTEKVTALVTAAQRAATAYSADGVSAIPAIEIPVTVTSTAPGPDKNFSTELASAAVEPFVTSVTGAGVVVLLRFEPGGTPFGDQFEEYDKLLANPLVGVSLDVSQRRATPTTKAGVVDVDELNTAFADLAKLVRDGALPQKVVVVHRKDAESVVGRERLALGEGELAVVFAERAQGRASADAELWSRTRADVPVGAFGGWTTLTADPVRDAEDVLQLVPKPEYISGAF